MPVLKRKFKKVINNISYDIYMKTSADLVDYSNDKSVKDIIDELAARIETLESSGVGGGTANAPVRGVDYWTEDDINAIKQYCEEAILGGEW